MSHAVRYLMEYHQILQNGEIEFPLNKKDLLKDIKQGKILLCNVDEIMINLLNETEQLAFMKFPDGCYYDKSFVRQFVKLMYKMYNHPENFFNYNKTEYFDKYLKHIQKEINKGV